MCAPAHRSGGYGFLGYQLERQQIQLLRPPEPAEYAFDVRPLRGKTARIELRDQHRDGCFFEVKVAATRSEARRGNEGHHFRGQVGAGSLRDHDRWRLSAAAGRAARGNAAATDHRGSRRARSALRRSPAGVRIHREGRVSAPLRPDRPPGQAAEGLLSQL